MQKKRNSTEMHCKLCMFSTVYQKSNSVLSCIWLPLKNQVMSPSEITYTSKNKNQTEYQSNKRKKKKKVLCSISIWRGCKSEDIQLWASLWKALCSTKCRGTEHRHGWQWTRAQGQKFTAVRESYSFFLFPGKLASSQKELIVPKE